MTASALRFVSLARPVGRRLMSSTTKKPTKSAPSFAASKASSRAMRHLSDSAAAASSSESVFVIEDERYTRSAEQHSSRTQATPPQHLRSETRLEAALRLAQPAAVEDAARPAAHTPASAAAAAHELLSARARGEQITLAPPTLSRFGDARVGDHVRVVSGTAFVAHLCARPAPADAPEVGVSAAAGTGGHAARWAVNWEPAAMAPRCGAAGRIVDSDDELRAFAVQFDSDGVIFYFPFNALHLETDGL